MLLKKQWCLTFMVIVWAQVSSQQDDAQPSDKKIMKAISNLENRIEGKLEVLLEEFKALKIKIDQFQDGCTWKQDCTNCLCRNDELFCATSECRPEKEAFGEINPATSTISTDQSTTAKPITGEDMYNAGKRGDLDYLKNALASGTDVNLQESEWPNGAALHGAVHGNHPAVVRALLAAGADKDLQAGGHTSIMEAAIKGKVDILNILIAQGADVNIPVEDGTTPLSAAASQNKLSAVKVLLDANATMGNPGKRGYTALHWAAWNSNAEIAQVLLKAGADPRKKTPRFGQTPADVARQYGYDSLANIIDNYVG